MAYATMEHPSAGARDWEHRTEAEYERHARWCVDWTAVWVGALAAVSAAIVLGLVGIALGAQLVRPERVVDLKTIKLGALVFSVCAAFFTFVLGGWISCRIAGILRAEPAMLHGAIVWLVAIPLLVAYATFGATSLAGAWYGGLAGSPAWVGAVAPTVDTAIGGGVVNRPAPMMDRDREDAARAARNSALGTVSALLLGLVGSVVGGWMGSGEPMTLFLRRAAQEVH